MGLHIFARERLWVHEWLWALYQCHSVTVLLVTVGGSSSLLGAAPRRSLQVAQVGLYTSLVTASAAFPIGRRSRAVPKAAVSLLAVALVASAAQRVLEEGPRIFHRTRVELSCVGSRPTVCVGPGYRPVAQRARAALPPYLRELAAAGAPVPSRFDRTALPGERAAPLGGLVYSLLRWSCRRAPWSSNAHGCAMPSGCSPRAAADARDSGRGGPHLARRRTGRGPGRQLRRLRGGPGSSAPAPPHGPWAASPTRAQDRAPPGSRGSSPSAAGTADRNQGVLPGQREEAGRTWNFLAARRPLPRRLSGSRPVGLVVETPASISMAM